ncbi:MAG: hypothetical protein JWL61_4991 [Gemmatimonadetes bacterium]|nr:hypothetical protein [Gemmatimonadota bacterium]
MRSPRQFLRAWLGIEAQDATITEAVDAVNGMSPIVLSVHKRLSHYERDVPAIQRIAKAIRAKHLREHTSQPETIGESASGEVA